MVVDPSDAEPYESPKISRPAGDRDYEVRGLWIPSLSVATISTEVLPVAGTELDGWQIVSAVGTRDYWSWFTLDH